MSDAAQTGTPPWWTRAREAATKAAPILVVVLGVVSAFPLFSAFPASRAWPIALLHVACLAMPLLHALHEFRKGQDVFAPVFVGSATFGVFHVLFGPLVLVTPTLLAHRGLDRYDEARLTEITLLAYFVLLASWLAYLGGVRLSRWVPLRALRPTSVRSKLFVGIGVLFVLLGIAGNVGFLGSPQLYLLKMLEPHARWEIYEMRADARGGTVWNILVRFLPVGLVVLAYGAWLQREERRSRHLAALLGAASVANVFLSCATGGRGLMLQSALFSLVVFVRSVPKLSGRVVGGTLVALLLLAFVLGQLREAETYGLRAAFGGAYGYDAFFGLYLSNFVGTLALVGEVATSGTVHGATALAGLKGLLGGPTPLTTQMEMWYRLTGSYAGSNPRYGPPGELFFNYGWGGVILGMLAIGILVGLLGLAYERSRDMRGIGPTFFAVFAAFSSNFIVIANLSYLPPYFTYYSAAFYLLFIAFKDRET